jgi:hypothetical protein
VSEVASLYLVHARVPLRRLDSDCRSRVQFASHRLLPAMAYMSVEDTPPACKELCQTSSRCQYLLYVARRYYYPYDSPISQADPLVAQKSIILFERTCFPPLEVASVCPSSTPSPSPSSSVTSSSSSVLATPTSSSLSPMLATPTPLPNAAFCGIEGFETNDVLYELGCVV